MAASDAFFRIYENVGYGSSDLPVYQKGNFRTYENIGFAPTPTRDATAEAYLNTGLQPMQASTDATGIAYENIGILPGAPLTIIRQPRGWGVIPTDAQSITILPQASAGTAEAYENIQ